MGERERDATEGALMKSKSELRPPPPAHPKRMPSST